jgi:hypothetical protein
MNRLYLIKCEVTFRNKKNTSMWLIIVKRRENGRNILAKQVIKVSSAKEGQYIQILVVGKIIEEFYQG